MPPTTNGKPDCMSEEVVERVRKQLGLTIEEKMTGRGALLLVQSAVLPPGSGITHTPCDKIRCGDVLCRGEHAWERQALWADAQMLMWPRSSPQPDSAHAVEPAPGSWQRLYGAVAEIIKRFLNVCC